MKVQVLAENTAKSDSLASEHGLSIYIETKNHKILYDCGQTDLFLHNAKKMGVKIKDVDTVIISHGHYDHGGGLSYFLRENHFAQVYMNKNVFGNFFNADGKFIGLDKDLINDERFIFIEDSMTIDKELYVFSANNYQRPFFMDNYGLTKKVNGEEEKDDFSHEQYLIINDGKQRVLFSGCSHKGVLNILDWAKPFNINAFVGGFHFMKIPLDNEGKETLDKIAIELDKYPIKYYTGHCTGLEQYNYLKCKIPKKLRYISTGTKLNINEG